MAYDNSDVVIDRSRATWSDLWLKEDYWAIWIGLILLLAGTCLVFSNRSELESKYQDYAAILRAESAKPIKTVEYYQAAAAQKALAGPESRPGQGFYQLFENACPLAVQSAGCPVHDAGRRG